MAEIYEKSKPAHRNEDLPEEIIICGERYSTSLTELDLSGKGLCDKDIVPLMYMTDLTGLSLFESKITDIAPLAQLTNLTNLDLSRNKITDITPLSQLTKLTELNLEKNKIKNWSPVAHIKDVKGRPESK